MEGHGAVAGKRDEALNANRAVPRIDTQQLHETVHFPNPLKTKYFKSDARIEQESVLRFDAASFRLVLSYPAPCIANPAPGSRETAAAVRDRAAASPSR